MDKQHKIDYIELPATNLQASKQFFGKVFNWTFEDYGSEYSAFFNAGLTGGFYQSELCSSTANGASLVVLYASDLDQTLERVKAAGGKIIKPPFNFPGGRRFHFTEPSGNELAVWSDDKLSTRE